ncbi:MAG: hypothetical protein HY303_01465, partial [Candidatus Wallbacteria bacterium]|nr:hypothetical protein [Candidatus Wallbacteria bacterium]
TVLLSYSQPVDISLDGHRIDEAFLYTTRLIACYFLIVVAVMGYCLLRFQARPGHKAEYIRGDQPRHLLLTGALAASVFLLIDLRLIDTAGRDVSEVFWKYPAGKDVLPIEVMAQQFEWHFRYAGPDGKFNTPDDIESNGTLHVPTGRPVVMRLRARDVIHCLFLPNVRLKQDVIPGRQTQLWFQAAKTGDYEIACAQLCGLGHYKMRGQFVSEDPKDFDAWLAKAGKEAAEEYDPKDQTSNWGWDWESH